MARMLSRDELESTAAQMRLDIVELCHRSPHHKAHLGGCLSCTEILAALYTDVMNTGRDGTPWAERDRFVPSKSHAAITLYAALYQAGFLTREDLAQPLAGEDTPIPRHPRRNPELGIETSGGSLGMGLSYGCGLALAARRRSLPSHVYVLLGDGECDEGSVWEAAAFAGHNALANLTAIVDANGLQLDAPCADVLGCGDMLARWRSFGFEAVDVDGHDVVAVRDALAAPQELPRVVVCHTIKGKGVSFAENRVEWHDNFLTDDLYHEALAELGATPPGPHASPAGGDAR